MAFLKAKEQTDEFYEVLQKQNLSDLVQTCTIHTHMVLHYLPSQSMKRNISQLLTSQKDVQNRPAELLF